MASKESLKEFGVVGHLSIQPAAFTFSIVACVEALVKNTIYSKRKRERWRICVGGCVSLLCSTLMCSTCMSWICMSWICMSGWKNSYNRSHDFSVWWCYKPVQGVCVYAETPAHQQCMDREETIFSEAVIRISVFFIFYCSVQFFWIECCN